MTSEGGGDALTQYCPENLGGPGPHSCVYCGDYLPCGEKKRDRLVEYLALPRKRRFECFFNFLGWWQWSVGIHVDVRHPHLDIHVPFGFARIGWCCTPL